MRRLGFETLVPHTEEAVRGGCKRVLREPELLPSLRHSNIAYPDQL
jgi:hypothetical protein